uniref:Uncharacterized protein n=1 Tax=Cannabis sativa TaxID=3483 RepID=A0A803PY75_CANSA
MDFVIGDDSSENMKEREVDPGDNPIQPSLCKARHRLLHRPLRPREKSRRRLLNSPLKSSSPPPPPATKRDLLPLSPATKREKL